MRWSVKVFFGDGIFKYVVPHVTISNLSEYYYCFPHWSSAVIWKVAYYVWSFSELSLVSCVISFSHYLLLRTFFSLFFFFFAGHFLLSVQLLFKAVVLNRIIPLCFKLVLGLH